MTEEERHDRPMVERIVRRLNDYAENNGCRGEHDGSAGGVTRCAGALVPVLPDAGIRKGCRSTSRRSRRAPRAMAAPWFASISWRASRAWPVMRSHNEYEIRVRAAQRAKRQRMRPRSVKLGPAETAFLTRREIVGNRHQRVRLADDHALPADLDDAVAFPLAHEAADREQGRAGHLRDVFARQRQIDEHAPFLAVRSARPVARARARRVVRPSRSPARDSAPAGRGAAPPRSEPRSSPGASAAP